MVKLDVADLKAAHQEGRGVIEVKQTDIAVDSCLFDRWT
jgi:hypothetical protein